MKKFSKKEFWDLKPYWCQPWTIIFFGVFVLIITWIFFGNLLITSIATLFIVIWWVIFLIIVPSSYEKSSD
tara:strand:- start:258 stop:470 length:213 start_codon:yes stop_codon:yes gene_type:complete